MTGAPELLNCPFCGGEARTESTITDASVWCNACKATVVMKHYLGPTVGWDASPRVAAAWNRRAALEPETPTPGQFTTMCLAIEDVVTGRGFGVETPEEVKAYLRNALMVGGWRGE